MKKIIDYWKQEAERSLEGNVINLSVLTIEKARIHEMLGSCFFYCTPSSILKV
ncbi:hypothetical protein TEHD86_2102 [Tetragenococcus halophilus subsp. halophilus]|uniref:Uncharacterized protein n=2 Tax=Tetragenococcus halophilus TaxID=51669 RepID=A0A2H6E1K8_TETHA|nr:hypothetical protein [Tetragenococcus halophilus]BAK95662.1 hypothetical protein TEH_23350 [Tetragenococcus halophilus NBRC 12172]GBD59879.1 hypothetical protein TEHN0098T_1875 [Tetragenococcus halophilus subsp. halophilus]GBD68769.1 hypothetical protein TEHN7118_1575 [Tetragenococcus halophilus subsp. halophilus]GBD70576.1 hypothetical protein TEHN7121_1122 [Tetragenococcus halophilus subsp. halophilus]GBD73379.1 hypothetical protein TEHN7125_1539 [Tetragenococcus halophilus subsp. halophi